MYEEQSKFFFFWQGLAMALMAIGRVDSAQTKMEGILAILQKQLEKIQVCFLNFKIDFFFLFFLKALLIFFSFFEIRQFSIQMQCYFRVFIIIIIIIIKLKYEIINDFYFFSSSLSAAGGDGGTGG